MLYNSIFLPTDNDNISKEPHCFAKHGTSCNPTKTLTKKEQIEDLDGSDKNWMNYQNAQNGKVEQQQWKTHIQRLGFREAFKDWSSRLPTGIR